MSNGSNGVKKPKTMNKNITGSADDLDNDEQPMVGLYRAPDLTSKRFSGKPRFKRATGQGGAGGIGGSGDRKRPRMLDTEARDAGCGGSEPEALEDPAAGRREDPARPLLAGCGEGGFEADR